MALWPYYPYSISELNTASTLCSGQRTVRFISIFSSLKALRVEMQRFTFSLTSTTDELGLVILVSFYSLPSHLPCVLVQWRLDSLFIFSPHLQQYVERVWTTLLCYCYSIHVPSLHSPLLLISFHLSGCAHVSTMSLLLTFKSAIMSCQYHRPGGPRGKNDRKRQKSTTKISIRQVTQSHLDYQKITQIH